jgi:hypothetical protein
MLSGRRATARGSARKVKVARGWPTVPTARLATMLLTILGASPPRAASPSSLAKKRFRDKSRLTGDRE